MNGNGLCEDDETKGFFGLRYFLAESHNASSSNSSNASNLTPDLRPAHVACTRAAYSPRLVTDVHDFCFGLRFWHIEKLRSVTIKSLS